MLQPTKPKLCETTSRLEPYVTSTICVTQQALSDEDITSMDNILEPVSMRVIPQPVGNKGNKALPTNAMHLSHPAPDRPT